jgi:hypothetical protein
MQECVYVQQGDEPARRCAELSSLLNFLNVDNLGFETHPVFRELDASQQLL